MDDENTERSELVDRYLLGRLNDTEMRHFKKKLKDDEALRKELENAEISVEAIKNFGLRNELKSIRKAMLEEETLQDTTPAPQGRVVSIRQYATRIAATILLVLVGFLAIQVATLSREDLYTDKAFPYEVTTGRNVEETDAQNQAIQQSYADEDFEAAVRQYESLSDPPITATFIAGNAYLHLRQSEEAIRAFQKVLDLNQAQSKDLYLEDATYNLALSYLQAGQYEDALARFQAIRSSDSVYSQYVDNYFLLKLRMLNWFD